MDMETHFTKGAMTAIRIHEAGKELFAVKGYSATTMREIAAKANIGAAAIYNHYKSKQDLLQSILNDHMLSLLQAVKNIEKIEDSALALQAFVEFHIAYHHDKYREVFLSYNEMRNVDDQNIEAIVSKRDSYENILSQILERGQLSGVFKIDDLQITTKAIIGMLTSLSNWYHSQGRLSLDQLIEIYWNLTRQMVGREQEPKNV